MFVSHEHILARYIHTAAIITFPSCWFLASSPAPFKCMLIAYRSLSATAHCLFHVLCSCRNTSEPTSPGALQHDFCMTCLPACRREGDKEQEASHKLQPAYNTDHLWQHWQQCHFLPTRQQRDSCTCSCRQSGAQLLRQLLPTTAWMAGSCTATSTRLAWVTQTQSWSSPLRPL